MKIVSRMQEYYRRRAGIYDASMGYDDPQVVARLAPVIDYLRRRLHGRTVLELACGPCFWTEAIEETVQSIVAMDYNETTLAMAWRKQLNWQKIRLCRADAYWLPFRAAAFDACLAVDWFAHVPLSRMRAFLDGLRRCLMQGATVIFCDRMLCDDEELSRFDEDGNHLQERVLPDGSRYLIIKHFFTDDQYRSLLADHVTQLAIDRYPDSRRVLVSCRIGAAPGGGSP